MPGVTKAPMKRGLAEANNTRANVQASPRSAKKLKLENGAATVGIGRAPAKVANGSFNSSQPAKSRFEEEVLEKMSQDIETLKYKNAEKDQQWHRPNLPENFRETTHSLIFQQIEAEEGVLNGGRATVKLFGVTEVSAPHVMTGLS
jgi:DNA polymerase delta subunit 1